MVGSLVDGGTTLRRRTNYIYVSLYEVTSFFFVAIRLQYSIAFNARETRRRKIENWYLIHGLIRNGGESEEKTENCNFDQVFSWRKETQMYKNVHVSFLAKRTLTTGPTVGTHTVQYQNFSPGENHANRSDLPGCGSATSSPRRGTCACICIHPIWPHGWGRRRAFLASSVQ